MLIQPFHPGRSPCNGACDDLEWATTKAKVPMGEPILMSLPEGSILTYMTYARDGVPYGTESSYQTVQEHIGVGYTLPDGTVFFRVTECGNWTHAIPPPGQIKSPPLPITPSGTPQILTSSPGVFFGTPTTGTTTTPGDNQTPPDTPVIPLPATLSLMLLAIAFVMIWRYFNAPTLLP